MEYKTWGEIRREIQSKHGIGGVLDYKEESLIDMYNTGANLVEAEIIKLNQDYFVSDTEISVVAGQREYDLPSDIYASKIRRVFIKLEGEVECKLPKAKNIDDLKFNTRRTYKIFNNATGRKLRLSFDPKVNGTLHIIYTRNTNKFTVAGGESQVCDIPEYVDAVKAWMSYEIEFNDKTPTVDYAKNDYDRQIQNLIASLAQAVNDEDNDIEPDTSFDEDHL